MKKKRQIERSALFLVICQNGADFYVLSKIFFAICEKVLDKRTHVLNVLSYMRFLLLQTYIFIVKIEINLSMQECL